MTWSDTEIIELVFVPIYFLLFLIATYAFIRHSHNKRVTFGLLFLFPLIRCVGNIVLIVAFQDAKKSNPNQDTLTDLFTAGFILELAGFGILLGAGLNLTNRAIMYDPNQQRQGGRRVGLIGGALSSPSRFLQLLNTVASILLIVGITNSTSAFSANPDGQKISSLAVVGCILLLVTTILLFLLASYHLCIKGPVTPSARTILIYVSIACFPMVARMAWSTYKVESSNLAKVNPWGQLVLQYLMECLATSIIITLSFHLARTGGDSDLDERRAYNDRTNPQPQQFNYSTQPPFASPSQKESNNIGYPPMPSQAYNAA